LFACLLFACLLFACLLFACLLFACLARAARLEFEPMYLILLKFRKYCQLVLRQLMQWTYVMPRDLASLRLSLIRTVAVFGQTTCGARRNVLMSCLLGASLVVGCHGSSEPDVPATLTPAQEQEIRNQLDEAAMQEQDLGFLDRIHRPTRFAERSRLRQAQGVNFG